ncbi:prepilin-type N-terminal cleavage/methylation domain-containing protein [Thiocapsa sp.]|uniref:pilin n=1 Tax=Thiocapsa sp. TaxID=2024551 RepID=UPI003592F029
MKPNEQGFNLIELMIVVAIIGILAAVAVPAYRDYAIRAKVSEVLLEVGKVKTDLSLFYSDHGRFPINSAERAPFEIVSTDQHPTIRRLELKGVGACNAAAGCAKARMEVMLRRSVYDGIGGDANSQLRLEGHGGPNGGVVTWLCGPRDVQPLKLEWLPATCRHPPS